ncbi:MAG: type IV pilin [Theionarchaea archaeon]|nr:type IV pilin [Theionarchaea archaeon]
MNILKWLKKKKGVSPVIAVVLMIAVAVAIAVIVYAWASGFTSEKTQAESAEAEQLVLESQDGSTYLGNVYVRNATSTPATLTTLYVNGVLQTFTSQVVSGNTVTVVDLSSFNISAGQEVMLVTEEGTQIKFKAKF